jgi:hypothetical protein
LRGVHRMLAQGGMMGSSLHASPGINPFRAL